MVNSGAICCSQTICINESETFTADENVAGASYNWMFEGANNLYEYTDKKPKIGRTYYRIHQMSLSNEALIQSKTEMITLVENQLRYELEVGDLVHGNYILRLRLQDGKSIATKILKL